MELDERVEGQPQSRPSPKERGKHKRKERNLRLNLDSAENGVHGIIASKSELGNDTANHESIHDIQDEGGFVQVVTGFMISLRKAKNHVEDINSVIGEQAYQNLHIEPEMVALANEGEESRPATAGFTRARCLRSEFHVSWFEELQELSAGLSMDFSVEDFLDRKRKECEEDCGGESIEEDSNSFVALAMESDTGMNSHLLCHASEGYFIPKRGGCNVRLPVFDSSVPGGWIGSSDVLMEELIQLCSALNLDLRPLCGTVRRGGGMDLSLASLELLNKSTRATFTKSSCSDEREEQLSRLRHTWFVLYEFARLSVASGSFLLLEQVSDR